MVILSSSIPDPIFMMNVEDRDKTFYVIVLLEGASLTSDFILESSRLSQRKILSIFCVNDYRRVSLELIPKNSILASV